jgi:hypothetical protein
MVNSPSGWNPAAGLRGGQPLKGILKQPKPFVPPPRQAPPAFRPSNSYPPSRQQPPRPVAPEPPEPPPETEGATIAGDIEGALGGDVVPTRERLE